MQNIIEQSPVTKLMEINTKDSVVSLQLINIIILIIITKYINVDVIKRHISIFGGVECF